MNSKRLVSARRIIVESGLFDPTWYSWKYPDVGVSGVDALDHFLQYGAAELRNPSPFFIARYYATTHAGDPRATENPLLHYVENGGSRDALLQELRSKIERSGLFDPVWYLKQYPEADESGLEPLEHFLVHGVRDLRDPSPIFCSRDYAAEHRDDPDADVNPLLHYIERGGSLEARRREIRDTIDRSRLFDPVWYSKHYSDVGEGGLDPLEHFVLHGAAELRDPSPLFHSRAYVAKHAGDAAAANPLLHYIEHGGSLEARLREIRDAIEQSQLFDAASYLEKYPDVAAGGLAPLDHFLLYGAKELRDPSPFFYARGYLRKHAEDVTAVENPLLHYIENGGSREARFREIRDSIEEMRLFDPIWYLEKYPDVAAARYDPLEHFIRVGATELRDPNRRFSAMRYAAMNAVDPYARANPLVHFIDRGGPSPNNALAIALLAGVAELDPDLAELERSILTLPSNPGLPRSDRTSDAWRRLFASLDRPFDTIIFVPSPQLGEADASAASIVRALVETRGVESFLVVATDDAGAGATDWLADGSQIRTLADFDPDLSTDSRVELISWLIRALKPKSVLNVNSQACWELFHGWGAALSSFCDLYAVASFRGCDEGEGNIAFANHYLRTSLQNLKQVFVANAHLVEIVRSKFAIPPSLVDRFSVIHPPPPEAKDLRYDERRAGTPFPVLTVARLCERANVDSLIELAGSDDSFSYRCYVLGEAAYLKILSDSGSSKGNIIVQGACGLGDTFAAGQYGAFLYMSTRCGSFDALLSAAMAGLPVVASAVGGVDDLVDEETGWLIRDHRNPAAYLRALGEIKGNPELVKQRLVKMRERLAQRYRWEAFVDKLAIVS
jgi:hypothetical protein